MDEYNRGINTLHAGNVAEARELFVSLRAASSSSGKALLVSEHQLMFAISYCDYKRCDYAAVQSALAGVDDPACLNLRAQALYNLEEFAEAAVIYEELLSKGWYRDDVEKTELLTNLTAAYSQCDPARCSATAAQRGMPTFDVAFNAATAMIHAKQYSKARELLAAALSLCLHEHDFDANTTDILELVRNAGQSAENCPANILRLISDAAPVLVQRAYVHFALGERDSATEILKELLTLRSGIISTATYAALCVNWAAIKRDSDYFDTLKRLKEVQQPHVEAKLTSRQKLFVKYNACLLILCTSAGSKVQRGADRCKRIVDEMCAESPKSELSAMALTAWLSRHGMSPKAENTFRSFVTQRGNADVTARLTMAQFALLRGDLRGALERLRADKALLAAVPSALATVVHSYATVLNDRDTAVGILMDMRQTFDSDPDAERRVEFYAFSADFCVAHHRPVEAVAILKRLLSLEQTRGDRRRGLWIRRLVIAAARCDPATAIEHAASLQQPQSLKNVGAQPMPRQGVEEAGLRRPPVSVTPADARKRPIRSRPLRKKPKGLENQSSHPPIDPERWVPIKQRTYMRDLPPRRLKELKRRRAAEQEEKRRQAERRKREATSSQHQ